MPRRKKLSQKTLINYIIDESGSMSGISDQVRSGFNEYVQEVARTGEGEILLTLTKFSTSEQTPFTAVPLGDVPTLDRTNYMPGGGTALYDAIANTIKRVEKDVDENTNVVTVIMTDGQENSSIENSEKQVNQLIKQKTDEGNWTFVFLGADQDAWAQAQGLGIARGNTVSYAKHQHTNSMRSLASATATRTAAPAAATADFFADAGQKEEDYLGPNVVVTPNTDNTTSST